MSDQEVAVKISADVKSLLEGMKASQEATEKATAGMKGDLGALIESFEHLGPAALVIGAAGLAFEALKEAKDIIMEAVHSTDELARSFETLHMRTGASYEDLTVYKNAMVLTGGTVDDFSGLLNGLSRKMAANSEIYIANGIAANKTELEHQDLMVTLAKSVQVIASIEDPGRRAEVAIALLGGRAQAMLPQIMRMNKMIGEEGVEALKKLGATIDTEAVEKHERLEKAIGDVKLEIEKVDQALAESGRGWAVWGVKLNLIWHQATLAASDYWKAAFPTLLDDEDRRVAALKASWAKEGITPKDGEGKEGGGESGALGKKPGKTQQELDAEKAAAAERVAMRKAADAEIIRSAESVYQEIAKNDKELVAIGAMTESEKSADLRTALKQRMDDELAVLESEKKILAGKPAELQAIVIREKEIQQKYMSDLIEIGRQESEAKRKADEQAKADAEKSAKQKLELAKLAAQDELNLKKTVLAEKDRTLDQDLAFGRINEAQWVAMKKAGLTQELRAQLDALDEEQKAAKDDLVAWTKIQNQKDALNRKTYLELGKLDADAVNASKVRWDGFFHSMTGGFASSISGLIQGTMSWGQAMQNVLKQGLDGLINYFVTWGEQEAVKWATSLAMGETGRVTEATGAAAVYAINAMGSVAAIPFYGWAMAPEVGASAYAEGLSMAGLASAEGGWERVPADQVAQLHKNEQVLPASYAEGLRNLVANQGSGGGAAGDIHLHMHGEIIDQRGVEHWFDRNQGALLRTLNGAVRNGRRA